MAGRYTTRTIFLQNFFTPAADVARHRRGAADMQSLISAMKRTELADKTLERELDAFAEKGFQIVTVIQHPIDPEYPHDLILTVILNQTE